MVSIPHANPQNKRPRIFISIASFCDPLLIFTVRNAVKMAQHPERLCFGIVDQSQTSSEADLPAGPWRIASLHVPPHQSRGACWARSLAMTFYAGEEYFFQIDSHSCFDQGWDVTLIDALETIAQRNQNPKVILSTRPFAFEIDETQTIKTTRFTDCTLKLVPKKSELHLSDPVLSFACYNSKQMNDLQGFQISAANVFTRGSFVEEVPYDPFFYFHGEEQNISIRAITSGWDIWHPNAVPLYHLYKKRSTGEAPLHWDPQFEAQRNEKWTELRSRARTRLSQLISGRLNGVYGLGSVRTMQDYLQLSGLTLIPNTPATNHTPAIQAVPVRPS
ncbi:GlcNAc-transferase family protein [Pacificibacter marinus]|uniref:Glycosyltransferase (GlcNAc) n=1 Tax=Pacificibacter marinus TaxID=658057 RepID=A0A1Y5SPQ5_9RHOB|nr:GlcNAc-transferase family protein [Pacificibacter marinus]SEK69620.1 Glycosyltransferase (GlcNAc) [Pacificibacter marinus]SLN45342.1 Glycosyltransferase (GlcNAc) [Pacificibacter marinus]